MDVLTLLTADHNRVRGLFARYSQAEESDDGATMVQLADRIGHELEVHTDIEETVFYPWARGLSDDVDTVVAEGIEEHHVAKTLLDEIRALEPGADDWKAKLTVLIENVEHHAGEEEDELFPQLASEAGSDELDALADEVEARKAQLGAPVLADKLDLTNEELHRLASEQQIPGRSSMAHDELAATVSPV